MEAAGKSTRRARAERISVARWLCVGLWLLVSAAVPAEHDQYEVVFEGRPGKRVTIGYTEAGWTVRDEMLDTDDSEEYLVRVVKDRRGNHFWASREMRPMAREESGGMVTYSAGASGYVKTYREPVLDMVRQAGVFEPGHEYMEHLTNVLYSVNYWGTRTDY
ncbi:MAG: hypothetical protein OXH49_06705 [Gemmatimonadetes bacterium]|nr:hypothetical protein [Gemmatimonadota bacterium]